jgi:hypothetical protein
MTVLLINENVIVDNNTVQSTTYCQRFTAELNPCGKAGWFTITDPATGRDIDVKKSFAYIPFDGNVVWYLATLLWKVIIVAFAWISFAQGISIRDIPIFFFAYLSNWGVTTCCIYLTFSLINCLLVRKTSQPEKNTKLTWRVYITWLAFVIGIHTTSVATLLFWNLLYDPDETRVRFCTITAHGGLFLLVAIDGSIVNRIPIRVMHWIGVLLPFDLIFIAWSMIHDLATNIGNPDNTDNDPSTNDDAIYQGVLEWDTKPKTAIKWTIICVFVLGLILFVILWSITTYVGCDRLRYYDINKNNQMDDDEEGQASTEMKRVVTD